jgi:putative hydrolase of the HAD superfamily
VLGKAKLICFDADQTLIAFRPAMREALRLALSRIRALVPGSETLTVERLVADRDAVAAKLGARASMETIRRQAFRRSLAPLGASDEVVAAVTDAYLADRFRLARPYEDVIPTLNALHGRYALGLATNGNSYPERAGLGGYFGFALYAHECGFRKPHPGFFAAVRRAAQRKPEQIVYVGDSLHEDIAGAKNAGFKTVWINRERVARPSSLTPEREIASLTELLQERSSDGAT